MKIKQNYFLYFLSLNLMLFSAIFIGTGILVAFLGGLPRRLATIGGWTVMSLDVGVFDPLNGVTVGFSCA